MSTVTTYEGPVVHLAVNYQPETAQTTHEHTDVHTSSEDLGVGTVSAKRIQVSDLGSFNTNLPSGLVVERATVTEEMEVIDDAMITVQPSEEAGTPVVVVGRTGSQVIGDTGVMITRAHKQIKLNARSGITARKLSVITSRVESKSALFSSKCQATNLFVREIRPIKGSKTTTFIGDLHVRGKVLTRDLDVSGKATMVRKHDGEDGHQRTLTLDDGSLYIGLMRRSYDRATQKPVTHILKRQIPAYLVAKGFVANDIPDPFTVSNMTINHWVTLAQDYLKDTSIEVATVFPASTTADWEDYIDPISIDLDAAEVEIDALDTRITALETISGVVVYDNLSDNDDLPILSTDRIVLVRHSEKQGIVCTLPSSGMLHGQIIVIKNYQIGDGSNQDPFASPEVNFLITVRPAQNQTPAHSIDGKFTSLTLNASSDASGALEGVNEACRLMWESVNKTWIALNDAY